MVADKNNYEFGFNPRFNYDYHNGYNQLNFLDLNYGKIHNASFHENPDGIENIWEEKFNHSKYDNGDSINYFYYQDNVWNISDKTKLIIQCCQDKRYFQDYKNKIREWLPVKEECLKEYYKFLEANNISLGENVCVINVRGGAEYKSVPSLLLRTKYWEDSINIMLQKNPNMKFLCVTDDIHYGYQLFGNQIPIVHISVGGDYFILNNAKNLIISNSSFAFIPVWTNENDPFVIAPKYWARHNVSSGYWASSDVFTFGWNFLDRDGKLFSTENILKENQIS
jgi:hypothetical protein